MLSIDLVVIVIPPTSVIIIKIKSLVADCGGRGGTNSRYFMPSPKEKHKKKLKSVDGR